MKWFKKTIAFLFQIFLMAVLPFWVFLRGSIYLYESYDWYHWFAMIAMFALVFVILLIYVAMVWDAIFGANKISRRSLKGKIFFVLVLMSFYAAYALFSLSSGNAKSEKIHNEYLSLHPFMRIASGTLIFLDNDLMITSASRVKEDYKDMGLKTLKNSLHYKQSDGYVHAVDLRTKGRGELRNTLTIWYFKAMGFNTLRHMGTADHLHVSLSIKDKPGVI
ncbi:MAG: hypothetical protein AAFY45_32655 [Bacteroidota bacterium]